MSEWISVKDKLPPTERVLVYGDCFGVDAGYYQPTLNNWTDSMFINFAPYNVIYNVTHWQPLPEPPSK